MTASALDRISLREQIKDVILQRIVAGAYPPGARLVETRIAQELGVSQTSVREALRDLEHIGCVVHEDYRGCSVRTVTRAELLEAFPVRAALEALAAELAADRMDGEELGALADRYTAMEEAARRGDPQEHARADAAFHAAIVHGAGNAILSRQWLSLEPHSRTFITASLPESDLQVLTSQHLPILEALRQRQPAAAAQAMRAHLEEAAALVRAGAAD